jgi:hypothetical protein
MRETKGKCTKCRVVWIWEGPPLLRLAKCQDCLTPLQKTSHLSHLRRVQGKPRTAQILAIKWKDEDVMVYQGRQVSIGPLEVVYEDGRREVHGWTRRDYAEALARSYKAIFEVG